jgi:hypothetical protein
MINFNLDKLLSLLIVNTSLVQRTDPLHYLKIFPVSSIVVSTNGPNGPLVLPATWILYQLVLVLEISLQAHLNLENHAMAPLMKLNLALQSRNVHVSTDIIAHAFSATGPIGHHVLSHVVLVHNPELGYTFLEVLTVPILYLNLKIATLNVVPVYFFFFSLAYKA